MSHDVQRGSDRSRTAFTTTHGKTLFGSEFENTKSRKILTPNVFRFPLSQNVANAGVKVISDLPEKHNCTRFSPEQRVDPRPEHVRGPPKRAHKLPQAAQL